MAVGRVYLVGAGPGDPGLITRRGLELIRWCDVILFDRLVAPELVDEVRPEAERIFVGKTPDQPSIPQARIDALLVEKARAGAKVVRLKGGDPYVFGRGADEAQALAAAGIPFEVVPGVTSAVAVPAYAGISVTYPGKASSFAVITGHESTDRPEAAARWDDLARGSDTLVLLMGVGALDDATERLMKAGRRADEPCAVIEWGTVGRQRVVVGTLEKIADLAREADIKPPATTVVGEVVRLREALDWFTTRPLFAKRIVVTRSRADAGPFISALREAGAVPIHVPTIEVTAPESYDDLDRSLRELVGGSFAWALFSSVHGVGHLFARMEAAGLDARAFGVTKVAAVGPATAIALERRGIRPDLRPREFTAAAMAGELGPGGGTILLPRPADAPDRIVDDLRSSGWTVRDVVAYRTVAPPPSDVPDAIARNDYDVVTFTSGSSVRNFVARFGLPSGLDMTEGPVVACIGPSTADVARDLGLHVDVVAEQHTTDGLIAALVERFASS